ncbi:sulfite exporter TauE/SafE family protein [Zestomonas carbonaria]|uniref:Toxin VasX N-terminal region domain-containing protein n=1 Tax=Zestomonas carbonaria TaxID=2762745 RepID=A0A7U7IBR8_9GAMM|nr:sulfite exporter TauE/SafE family protein [Pseudomonas carbonaria]CAD5110606.1 hypothetical protein PSEWESI4_04929 [Pseudomonas carbonaria]
MTDTTPGGAASAPACSSRIPILPIRYAVVPRAADAARYRYADSGYMLETGFDRLEQSAYTLRALRPGYVYVFMKGPKSERLVIHEYDGEGQYQELAYTGLENYHKKDNYDAGKRMGWVWADTCPDTASEVWIGYSPHLWTNRMTARVTGDPGVRQRHMRRLDMQELTSGEKTPSRQAHVLPVQALGEWVEDYKPKKQRIELDWSSHSSKDELPLSTLLAQASHYPYTRPRVPVVVALNDAEGIGLDLSLITAAYQHQITDLKSPKVLNPRSSPEPQSALPSCMGLDVEKLHLASADFHRKNLVATLLEQTLHSMFSGSGQDLERLVRHRDEWHRAQPVNRKVPSQKDLRYQILTDERLSPAGARLAKRIDTAKYQAFMAERQAADEQLATLLEPYDRACADQDAWLSSAEPARRDDPRSLAATLASYDRDNRVSASGLELSIALLMHGMSQPMPGREDLDPRFQRLNAWVDDENSPLYMALEAYNPFKEKADAIGVLLGAAGNAIEELAGRFPAINGATDLIAQSVTVVTLKRIKGKTRWDASRTLRQQVLTAASEANTQKALGLLGARYRITDDAVRANAFSQEVEAFIKSGMAEVEHTRTVDVSGNRIVKVEDTQTRTVRPTLKSLLGVTTTGGAFNAGMLYFNIVHLANVWRTLESQYSHANAASFASAVLGTISAIAAALVSARAIYVASMSRLGFSMPGAVFSAGMARALSSRLFGRLFGWPAILTSFLADGIKAIRQLRQDNPRAGGYTLTGGIALALGSAAVLEGGFAIAGVTTIVPVAGWAAAAIVLIGAGLIAGGIWLHSKAAEEIHSPMELWAVRSQFGTRQNDGEIRPDTALDDQKRLPGYPDITAEIKGWYEAFYAPMMLSDAQAEALGWPGVDSTWHDNWLNTDRAEFTVLLPGFIQGQSTWEGGLTCLGKTLPPHPNQRHTLPKLATYGTEPTLKLIPAGLLMHYTQNVANEYDNLSLHLTYKPNQGLDEDTQISTSFLLKD